MDDLSYRRRHSLAEKTRRQKRKDPKKTYMTDINSEGEIRLDFLPPTECPEKNSDLTSNTELDIPLHLRDLPTENIPMSKEWWDTLETSIRRSRWEHPTWNHTCPYCTALLLKGETHTFCCNNGQTIIPQLPPLPVHIQSVISNSHLSRHLSSYSRRLNSLFCFTAIGASEHFTHFNTGTATVSITGCTYHRIFDASDRNHSLHWFLYDEHERGEKGKAIDIPIEWTHAFELDLHENNPYVHHLHRLHDSTTPSETSALEISDPSSNGDFAAIIHAADSVDVEPRSIIIWNNSERQPQFIPIWSRHYEPLQYPILFPHGTPGWGLTVDPLSTTNHLSKAQPFTQLQWYKGRILTDNRFLIFGRLCSEYLCDMYSRIEEERLNYIRQSRLLQSEQNQSNVDCNIDINLPASFLGSRRWASEQTADALALARVLGRPSFFITMTCNPDWPEIKERLRPGQNAIDAPVIVARAFKVRLRRLMQIIKTMFGHVVYVVKIIEFQKRGWPHAHIIIKITPELPLSSIDSLIKAELPVNNPHLHTKVKKFMTHSFNHLTRENSRCRKQNTCIYGFPHPITQKTWIDDDGRVHYKRTTDDDRWIVPHIPSLIDQLDCHIFVDIVYTVSVFMYLYKYLFKGPDQTWFRVPNVENETIDEIRDYVQGRYLSAPEAAWRILNFNITSKDPSVTSLPVHLPDQNMPQFKRGAADHGSSSSLLIHYFHRPLHPNFTSLTYTEYFQNYILYPFQLSQTLQENEYLEQPILGSTQHKVRLRSRGRKVARLQTLSPTAGEVFYLRAILAHKPVSSFIDSRTIQGIIHETFHEAALQLGLFSDTNEALYAMQEATASYQTPPQLRFLFARIILEGYPACPLWDLYQTDLSYDHVHRMSSFEFGTDRALEDISNYLQDAGRNLQHFGLPEPLHRTPEVLAELQAFLPRQEELQTRATEMKNQMNVDQQSVYHDILSTIETHLHHPNSNVNPNFIEGKPGRGKTWLVDALCCELRSRGLIVLVVGTSALAATLYEGGRTAHNLFRIPVKDDNLNIHSLITPRSNRADLIRNASLIVWDELPMANITAFECADEVCRSVTGCQKPFGGIPFLALGDFRQVAPVIKGLGTTSTLLASVKSSHLWRHFSIYTLEQPIRGAGDPTYTAFTDAVGIDHLHERISLSILDTVDSVDEAIDFLYPIDILNNPAKCLRRALLSPKNIFVDEFNNAVLDKLPTEPANYFSADLVKENGDIVADHPVASPDYLALITHNGIPPHQLRLKEGAVCSLMRNMCVRKGLVKNARLIIERLHHRYIEVRVINNRTGQLGEIHCIPRIRFEFSPQKASWTIQRIQYPLRLAYASTFNGCQGLTLDKTVLDLRCDPFAHGQLYTALSPSAKSKKNLMYLAGLIDI